MVLTAIDLVMPPGMLGQVQYIGLLCNSRDKMLLRGGGPFRLTDLHESEDHTSIPLVPQPLLLVVNRENLETFRPLR